ncbi:unnamed protein product [Schistosoma rodhaini]|uniref:Irx-related n=2 Tax=Schistosoma mansoni TaxID=6183 RepID=A0A3Q0KGS8_SCHMA|nr:unnamed protein product [Schistosoma rodhaini]
MDLDCTTSSSVSDSQSNEHTVESSPTVLGYENTIRSPTGVEHYSDLYDNRSNKIATEDPRNNLESSVNESGYSSYCNYSYISTEDAIPKPEESENQFCIDACHSIYTAPYVSENLTNTTCRHVEFTNDNNETVSAVASIVNHGVNSCSYIPVSNMITTVINHNYTPTVASEFSKIFNYQCDTISTPDVTKKNDNQRNFKSDPDTFWISQRDDLQKSVSRRTDYLSSDKQNALDDYMESGNIPTSTDQQCLQPQVCLNNYHFKEDESKQSYNSSYPEYACNIINTRSQHYTTKDFDYASSQNSVIDCISSYQDSSQSSESVSSYVKRPSFYSQTQNIYWPWIDRFYAENCASKLGSVYNSDITSKGLINYTNSFSCNPSFGHPYNSQSLFVSGSNLSCISEKPNEQSQSSKLSAVNLCAGETVSAFHSIAQMSSDYSGTSVVAGIAPNIILMNSQNSDDFSAQSADSRKESQEDENSFNHGENSWQPVLSSVQCLSRKRLTDKQRKTVCVSILNENRTVNSNIPQDETTHNSSTSFDISSLHRENEICLDQSISGNSYAWASKSDKLKLTSRLRSKRYSDAINLTRNRPLNQTALSVMESWYTNHVDNPYPTTAEKEELAALGGITVIQVSSWFANRRTRTANTKPKKNRRKLYHQIYQLAVEIEALTQGALRACDLQERIGQIIDEYLT